ncbi:MAG: acyl-[ACP]--phospholipid O-acyltransferase [Alphaproteobacteria bacterium]|nr:acyl-[ACP]--phospholipid O-acyltransferase [Alphaproteobacteria bacterium]
MHESQFHLLKTRRFVPLFITQFLGAMNDNLFRSALATLIIFRLADAAGLDGPQIAAAAPGIFILPFFLFSATAGQLADKFEKARLIRLTKTAEIAIMGLAAIGFFTGNVWYLLAVLFCMGLQSAFFGPLKYSVLPAHLTKDELVGGNALIETGTFLAILIGTILGTQLVLGTQGIVIVSVCVLGFALAGLAASFYIPKAPAPAPQLKINPNFLGEAWNLIGLARARRDVFLSILGISWFWLIGVTFLAQFYSYAKEVLAGDQTVVTLLLATFSIGIGVGSLACNKLLKGRISAQYVPVAAIGITVFIVDIYFASAGIQAGDWRSGRFLADAVAFLSVGANWRIIADLFGVAVCGGIYIVPLYAILQDRSDANQRARIIAANNIMNAGFMAVGAAVAAAILAAGATVPQLFLILGGFNAIAALVICRLLPEAILRTFFQSVLKLFYRVRVRGLEHYDGLGERAVIIVNHVSLLDGLLLAAFLPIKPVFAINSRRAKQWWIKPLLKMVDAFPMDPTNPMAIKTLTKLVRDGRHCVIFPEGRVSVTGGLMKIFEGPGMIADKADAPLLPVRIDGAQYSTFSRAKGKFRIRWFPRISITVQPPRAFDIPADLMGSERREAAARRLYDEMSNLIFETGERPRTLFQALLDAGRTHGGRAVVLEDIERRPLTYAKLILGSLVLGRKLASMIPDERHIGVLLPNANGAVVTFFALQAAGRVPAMLNFSAGTANMISACKTAEIKTVLTSRKFIEAAELEDSVAALEAHTNIIYLDDVREQIGVADKLFGFVARAFATRFSATGAPDDPAVILFTSGSEGVPKAVVLSHENLLANRRQLTARVDFTPGDIVFNALPIFHSFGLTGGMLLPVLSGIRTFLYPSPLHYKIVPAVVYDVGATIMFGTDTFLAGYGRVANPYDFFSVRYVFAGAEKVRDETRSLWSDKFGLRIFEGYGTTETAPVLSTNTAMHFKAGTVGRLMPGISATLEPVPGIEQGGRLIVSGPNIMLGYFLADRPGVLQPPPGGRYDTGDIVEIDGQGYVTIKGRAKRFAKIAGEMVSLGAAEDQAANLWPDWAHAVIAVPDPRKGEQLILITEHREADRTALLEDARAKGISELMVPKTVQVVEKIPLLATGKTDYPGLAALLDQ